MTAFDRAWELVKAPLDYDSIKDISIPGKGKRSMAYFDDPTTGKRYPMVNYGGSNIIVYDPNFANPHDEVDLNTYFDPWVANIFDDMTVGEAEYRPHINRDGENLGLYVDNLEVKDEYRRRGIASAMHDFFAQSIAPKRFTHGFLSHDGNLLWGNIYEMQAEEVPEGHPDFGKKSKERWNPKTGTPYWPLREEKT